MRRVGYTEPDTTAQHDIIRAAISDVRQTVIDNRGVDAEKISDIISAETKKMMSAINKSTKDYRSQLMIIIAAIFIAGVMHPYGATLTAGLILAYSIIQSFVQTQ